MKFWTCLLLSDNDATVYHSAALLASGQCSLATWMIGSLKSSLFRGGSDSRHFGTWGWTFRWLPLGTIHKVINQFYCPFMVFQNWPPETGPLPHRAGRVQFAETIYYHHGKWLKKGVLAGVGTAMALVRETIQSGVTLRQLEGCLGIQIRHSQTTQDMGMWD